MYVRKRKRLGVLETPRGENHTRTVVRECFKGDEVSQWKRPKFDPSPHQVNVSVQISI